MLSEEYIERLAAAAYEEFYRGRNRKKTHGGYVAGKCGRPFLWATASNAARARWMRTVRAAMETRVDVNCS